MSLVTHDKGAAAFGERRFAVRDGKLSAIIGWAEADAPRLPPTSRIGTEEEAGA